MTTIEDKQSIIDISIQLNGDTSNLISMMGTYQMISVDQKLSGISYNFIYNNTNNVVNFFLLENRNVVTSDTLPTEFIVNYYEFSNDFSIDFDAQI